MPGTFVDRIEQLREQVGTGRIVATVDVDQVYAHYQDSGEGPQGKPAAAFEHPEGGEAGYLTDSLTAMGPDFSDRVLSSIDEEEPMVDLFIEFAQELSGDVAERAPMEFANLRESAAATVDDNGEVVFDRPALVPRLSEEELRQLGKFSKWKYGGKRHDELGRI